MLIPDVPPLTKRKNFMLIPDVPPLTKRKNEKMLQKYDIVWKYAIQRKILSGKKC